MRLKLFLCALLFCTITKAQTSIELKDFINKNSGAIRTIQKNILRENNSGYTSTFKEILKNQEAAIRLYNTDQKASMYLAFAARTECLAFLKNHLQSSVVYFEITEAEKTFAKTSIESSKVLSAKEIKTIDDVDTMSTPSLNNLTITIQ